MGKTNICYPQQEDNPLCVAYAAACALTQLTLPLPAMLCTLRLLHHSGAGWLLPPNSDR